MMISVWYKMQIQMICVLHDRRGRQEKRSTLQWSPLFQEDPLKLWQDIQAEEAEKVKLKKADRIERIASVMSDSALFEGFCLAFYGKDEMLAVLCDEYGCMEAYEALSQDIVYRKKKSLYAHAF